MDSDELYLQRRRDKSRQLRGLAPLTSDKSSITIPKECTTLGTSNPMSSPTLSTTSTVSSSSKHSSSSTVSRRSSISTAPSTDIPPPWHQTRTMTRIDSDYDLKCEFAMTGCEHEFPLEEIEAWISHSFSHFSRVGPPPQARCIFCDDSSFSENFQDPVSNWRARMIHIGRHYQNHTSHETVRPDYFVIEYMKKNRLLTSEDYGWIMDYTERPPCDNLVDYDFKTPEMKAREPRGNLDKHDLRKEDRQMRRDKAKGRRERTHRSSHESREHQKGRS